MSRRMTDNWLSKRLRELGKTKLGLAEFLCMPQQHINKLADGHSITPERLTKMADYLEIDKTALLDFFSNGRMEEALSSGYFSTNKIAVIGYVQAGIWQEARQWEVSDYKPIDVPLDDTFREKKKYALEVRGNSMNLLYPSGTFVVCVSAEDYADVIGSIESGKKVIVERKNPFDLSIEATVKEYVKSENGTFLVPRSADPSFQPIRTDDGSAGEVKITGVVIGMFRKE